MPAQQAGFAPFLHDELPWQVEIDMVGNGMSNKMLSDSIIPGKSEKMQ